MPRRTYDPALQAALARRLRTVSIDDWEEYRRNWTAFNALYNVEINHDERDRVIACLRSALTPEGADRLLITHAEEIRDIAYLPPGDTRFESGDPRFRQRSREDAAVVNDTTQSPLERIARVGGLLYQVRCSLIHGNKDPSSVRDRMLVSRSNAILAAILPHVEADFDRRAG